ncbi:MAG: hypothetical protein M3O89_03105 [Actinomycetota bacterium]|nr:hypothetical protein [Actinomycetota bacterium]
MITSRVLVVVLAFMVCLSAIGYMAFPSPQRRQSGVTIKLPHHNPANDASGIAGWVWPDGVPGWTPGQTIKGFPVSFMQPVEVQAAQLAAARFGLDSDAVRVVTSVRGDRRGVLAILATHTMYSTPEKTCLAALLREDAPVVWLCPAVHTLSHQHVLIASARLNWPGGKDPIYLVGVARGDVRRVVLVDGSDRQMLYTRGNSWGEFDSVRATSPGAHLLVYGHGRVLETVRLDVPVGQQRVLR